jgi:hypothetical protein
MNRYSEASPRGITLNQADPLLGLVTKHTLFPIPRSFVIQFAFFEHLGSSSWRKGLCVCKQTSQDCYSESFIEKLNPRLIADGKPERL